MSKCPSCGYCPHCGRNDAAPVNPFPWRQPFPNTAPPWVGQPNTSTPKPQGINPYINYC